jgi:hypothetical protein
MESGHAGSMKHEEHVVMPAKPESSSTRSLKVHYHLVLRYARLQLICTGSSLSWRCGFVPLFMLDPWDMKLLLSISSSLPSKLSPSENKMLPLCSDPCPRKWLHADEFASISVIQKNWINCFFFEFFKTNERRLPLQRETNHTTSQPRSSPFLCVYDCHMLFMTCKYWGLFNSVSICTMTEEISTNFNTLQLLKHLYLLFDTQKTVFIF